MKPRKGFTLIELLIVVAIIGIITTVAVPNLIHFYNKGRATRIVDDINRIRDAALQYHMAKEEWPEDTWWGETPDGLQSYLPVSFSFEISKWNIRYSFDNYTDHSSWARNYQMTVGISINSSNKLLLQAVTNLAPNMFTTKSGFFGWKRLVYVID
jgi:prepilin-type N-terminal cleavage/methylation domain-containing protein